MITFGFYRWWFRQAAGLSLSKFQPPRLGEKLRLKVPLKHAYGKYYYASKYGRRALALDNICRRRNDYFRFLPLVVSTSSTTATWRPFTAKPMRSKFVIN
jgi:hypothetical protein